MSERDAKEPSGDREPSEMFSVRGPRAAAIPTLTHVPITPEEAQRRRRVRVTIAIASSIAVVLAIALGLYLQHRSAINAARVEAERTGRLPAIAAALARVDGASGAEDVALAARLHATAELEGEAGHREPAEALLAEHDARGEGASDHAIARVYLALASGDTTTALREVAPLAPTGPRAAESARARALVAAAVGDPASALASARAAVAAMPGAPRHRALLVELAARAGEPADAAGDETCLRVARAMAVIHGGGSLADAHREAEGVLASSDATPVETARARLVLGLAAAVEGDTTAAEGALSEAASAGPAGDELFRRLVAEGFLLIGARDHAADAIAHLVPGATADAALAARVAALFDLSGGDAAAATVHLASAPEGEARAWVEGRIALARGDVAAARTLLTRATSGSFFAPVARCDLGLLEVRAGRGAEAVLAMEPALTDGASWPRVASTAALALSLADARERALSVVEAALATHPDEPVLLAALGRVHLAGETWSPARDALTRAVAAMPGDATLERDLGLAERALGHDEAAIAALRRSVELDPTDAGALLPLLTLEVDTGAFEAARGTLARVDLAHLASLEIEHLRARFLVGSLAGQSGTRAVFLAIRQARRDGALHMAMARLYLQAARWTDAAGELMTAEPTAEDPRRATLILRALAYGRAGRERTVEVAAESLREDAATTPFTPIEEAMLLTAEGWIAWHDDSTMRATALARQALALDPTCSEALILLANVDEAAGRDPEPCLRAAMTGRPPSIEAYGLLALRGELDAERCGLGRRYLVAAPAGMHANAVRARIATCPAASAAP